MSHTCSVAECCSVSAMRLVLRPLFGGGREVWRNGERDRGVWGGVGWW